jgi:hypothetical protein
MAESLFPFHSLGGGGTGAGDGTGREGGVIKDGVAGTVAAAFFNRAGLLDIFGGVFLGTGVVVGAGDTMGGVTGKTTGGAVAGVVENNSFLVSQTVTVTKTRTIATIISRARTR